MIRAWSRASGFFVPHVIGQRKGRILNPPPRVNERWRVALAGIVAALAIPFLVLDAPGTAEGIETTGPDEVEQANDAGDQVAAPIAPPQDAVPDGAKLAAAVEVVVIEQPVSPDISLLASKAGNWGLARSEAVANGLVEVRPPAPSNTNLRLLPTVATQAPVEPEEASEPAVETVGTDGDGDPDNAAAENELGDPANEEDVPSSEVEPALDGQADGAEELVAPAEAAQPVDEEPPPPAGPVAPAQVDGRVPPPAGGPTAAQWDALRNCESTHNYGAINNTGTYRGAYQFSQQTWDWVAGIHWPHLVGIDPAAAQPAWQDIMAYTLFAMRGWDQWPICGQHLL